MHTVLTSPIHMHERSSLSQATKQIHGLTSEVTMTRRDGQRAVANPSRCHLRCVECSRSRHSPAASLDRRYL